MGNNPFLMRPGERSQMLGGQAPLMTQSWSSTTLVGGTLLLIPSLLDQRPCLPVSPSSEICSSPKRLYR